MVATVTSSMYLVKPNLYLTKQRDLRLTSASETHDITHLTSRSLLSALSPERTHVTCLELS